MRIRPYSFAPRFWETNVIIPEEMLCSGVNAKSSTRLTALNTAMASTPSPFTQPWISSFPTGWQACCSAVTLPCCSVSFINILSGRSSALVRRSAARLRSV